MLCYLFAEPNVWSKKPVSLAVDGGVRTPSNGIHFPVCVVVVHHMKIPVSASATTLTFLKLVSPKFNHLFFW